MVVSRIGGWLADNPLRVAGALAAVAATVYMAVAAQGTSTAGTAATGSGVTVSTVVDFAVAHPAYPALVVVGLAALFFAD